MTDIPTGHPSFGKWAPAGGGAMASSDHIKREMPKRTTPAGSKDQPGPADVSKRQLPSAPRRG